MNFLFHVQWFSTSIKSYLVTALCVCMYACLKKKKSKPPKNLQTKLINPNHKKLPPKNPQSQNTFFTGWRRQLVALEVRRKMITPFWRWYHCYSLGKMTVRKKQNIGTLNHLCMELMSVYFSVCVVFRGSWSVSFFRRIPFWNPSGMQRQWKMTTPPALWVTPFLFRVCKSGLLFMEKFPS